MPTKAFALSSLCSLLAGLLLSLCLSASGEEPRYYVYVTQKGDTLLKMSARFLIKRHDWKSLEKLNGVAETTQIPIGTRIRIPVAAMRADQSGATVLAVQGNVESAHGRVESSSTVVEGESIKTGEGAFVTLRLADGSTLTVQPKSQVQLATAKQYANTGGMTDTVVALKSGRVESSVAKQRASASRYEIRTATSNMGVRGTVFRASADAAGSQAGSEVLEGAVGVNATAIAVSKELALPAGFGTIIEAGKAPLPPVELLPAPDLGGLPAGIPAGDIEFRFLPVGGARQYRAQMARDADFKDLFTETLGIEPLAAFVKLPAGHYFLRVRGIDALGLEGRDAVRALSVAAEMPAPSALRVTSAEAATGSVALAVSRSPFSEFSWGVVEGSRAYHFQVARDAQFVVRVIDDPAIAENHYRAKIPLPSGNYWWRVAGVGPTGRAGPFSAPQPFLVAVALRLNRAVVEGARVRLSWDGPAGAEYQLQVAQDEYFRKPVKDLTVREPAAQIDELNRGAYFARVRFVGSGQHFGPWSEMEPFEVYGKAWILNVLPH